MRRKRRWWHRRPHDNGHTSSTIWRSWKVARIPPSRRVKRKSMHKNSSSASSTQLIKLPTQKSSTCTATERQSRNECWMWKREFSIVHPPPESPSTLILSFLHHKMERQEMPSIFGACEKQNSWLNWPQKRLTYLLPWEATNSTTFTESAHPNSNGSTSTSLLLSSSPCYHQPQNTSFCFILCDLYSQNPQNKISPTHLSSLQKKHLNSIVLAFCKVWNGIENIMIKPMIKLPQIVKEKSISLY